MKISHIVPPLAVMITAASLCGCASIDPYEKPGVWQPLGINAMNLQLQVAHPEDLAQGRGAVYADGHTAAQAVQRMRDDRVKPLIDWTTGTFANTSTQSGGGGGGGGGGGNNGSGQ